MRVKLDGGQVVNGCVWVGGPMAGLLGIKTMYTPPPGSQVLVVLASDGVYAVGGVPNGDPDANSYNTRTLTGTGSKLSEQTTYENVDKAFGEISPGPTTFNDVLEGEYVLANDLGVMLALLTNVARLQAGDRAKIEVCLLDSMARIVSDTFKHISAFGDMEIYNDGRLNVRWDGTSHEHEAWGLPTAKSPRAPSDGAEVDFDSLDSINETGRWRFSQYIGWLGDFIHEIVSDPSTVVGEYAKLSAEALRSGKARRYVGSDGTLLWQSVTEIAWEKVTRIVVPIELKRNEDSSGVKKREFDALETKYLKLWDDYDKPENLIHGSYQLREYARYINQYHSYARFLQMESAGVWRVPSESETPAPDINGQEEDRESVNGGVGYIETYSTIRIMRDGSHVFLDSYGTCTVTGENGVQHGTPKHYEVNCGGDYIVNAGQNIRLKARRSIDLVAVTGGIKIKGRAFMHFLSEWGTMWFKSDAVDPEKEDPPAADNPEQDPAPEVLPSAILFETSKGRMVMRSENRMILETRAEDEDLILQSLKANVSLQAGTNYFRMHAEEGVKLKTDKLLVNSPTVTFASESYAIGDFFTVAGGTTKIGFLETASIKSSGLIAGPGLPGPSPGIGQHFNHITEVDKDWKGPEFADAEEARDLLTQFAQPADTDPKESWDFKKRDEYIWDGRDLYEPLSQQFVRNDEPLPNGQDNLSLYEDWKYSDDKLKKAPRTGSNAPWPGVGGDRAYKYTGGDSLFRPSNTKPKDLKTKATGFSLQSIIHKYFKKPL
jgi:hypothetical protein